MQFGVDLVLKRHVFLFICIVLTSTYSLAQLVVDESLTPQQLVEDVLLGPGIIANNITYTGDMRAVGTFNAERSNIPLDSGIILTSGRAEFAIGPNSFGTKGNDNNMPGDSDLSLILGDTTFDAAILEFDFIPLTDTVSFRYIFASEEYNEYVCTDKNDIFSFFISGPGITGKKNIALIPGTNTPVAINTVNIGFQGSECGGAGNPPCDTSCILTNSQFFNDNPVDFNDSAKVHYDGYTTVFEAGIAVQRCETYHMKIAIADGGDGNVDSGVFLEAGSFKAVGVVGISLDSTNSAVKNMALEGCLDADFIFTRLGSNTQPLNVTYSVSGSATNGVDYEAIPFNVTIPANEDSAVVTISPLADDINEVEENVIVTLDPAFTCPNLLPSTAEIKIANVKPIEVSTNISDTTLCPVEPLALSAIALGGSGELDYLWSDGQTGNVAFVKPNESSNYMVTVKDTCGTEKISSKIQVKIDCQVVIQNVITPNNDGVNDVLVIENIEANPGSKLVLFNRWGRKVISIDNYDNSWRGTDKSGDPLTQGVYYYILELSNGKSFTGFIQLLR